MNFIAHNNEISFILENFNNLNVLSTVCVDFLTCKNTFCKILRILIVSAFKVSSN